MDVNDFWHLIDRAREQVGDNPDGESIAYRAADLLATHPVPDILAAQQLLWDRMAESYRGSLWAAAYIINGGCSDDGFDYFRGWLITRGRTVFERALSDPDTLADLPAVQAAAENYEELDTESMLSLAWRAHESATGSELPTDCWTIRYPPLADEWAFDFEDRDLLAPRLPKLVALYTAN